MIEYVREIIIFTIIMFVLSWIMLNALFWFINKYMEGKKNDTKK